MRLLSIVTALLVALVLYFVVIERERLLEFARDISPAAIGADATEAAETNADQSDPAAAPEEDTTAQDEAGESGAIAVMARRSTAQEVDARVLLRGETEAARSVDVMAETTGRIVSEPLRKGAFVEAGELLCKLDPGTRAVGLAEAEAALADAQARVPEVRSRIPEAEARVAQAEAALDEARINANAANRLSESGFASETRVAATTSAVRSAEASVSAAKAGLEAARSGLETSRAAIESAEAAVARAEDELSKTEITAPFAGLLETDTAELGALMQAGGMGGSACATILQLDPIRLVGYVPETDVGRVEVGARAGAQLTEGGEVSGRVTFVSRSADPVTRTFRVEVTVPNEGLGISAGQTAEIAIEAEGELAHLLPQSALTLNDDGEIGVRTITPETTALFRPVEILRDTSRGIYVAGLPETADVILLGQEYVTDGVPVAPSYEEVIQ
ncbi:Multidrug resistance protein MdtA precursor [Roseivivax sp. THAF40]|uniref:efflux RND transporter periplasmic adaptor subunit n=1 Tax=unclassified Roseivivax TaxID=2639302 RepID=UPI001267ADB9|nr:MULTISPECIES: efflux RND transporter periplasmic adaptor subunit [unclassified Roseivivax]QFS83181.1 Multidrug resistance protein MdtA precursor [Roseivivax sp. THAF197b]QFT46925.1 Multidrug resistance protein MdtA precursor [Roseivivax sp. THAF40]